MAISSETSSVTYTGNASTVTAYTLAFPFSGASEIVVTQIDADGVRSVLAVTTGYTLQGDPAAGTGTLKTVVAVPATDSLLIERFTAVTQTLESDSPAGSYPTSIETQLDRTTRALQDQKRVAGRNFARSIRVPDGETAAEIPAATLRAGEVLFFNATTGAVETKTPDEILALSSGAPLGVGVTPASIQAAAAEEPGNFRDAAGLPTFVNAADYGAIGDGTSHPVSQWLAGGSQDRGYANLAAIQAVIPEVTSLSNEIDWAATQHAANQINAADNYGGTLVLPFGHFLFNRPLVLKGACVAVLGQGQRATWIDVTADVAGIRFAVSGSNEAPRNMRLEDFTMWCTAATTTKYGVDTRFYTDDSDGFYFDGLWARRCNIVDFDACWYASNLPNFELINCNFMGRTYGVWLHKADTGRVIDCVGGFATDRDGNFQFRTTAESVFYSDDAVDSPGGRNFAFSITNGDYGRNKAFLLNDSGNFVIDSVNIEEISGPHWLRHRKGNLSFLNSRIVSTLADAADVIFLVEPQAASTQTLTVRGNTLESSPVPVASRGALNYEAAIEAPGLPIEWQAADGSLEFDIPASGQESKSNVWWNSIATDTPSGNTNVARRILRRYGLASINEQLLTTWEDGGGTLRRSNLLNTELKRVLGINRTQLASAAGAETTLATHTVPGWSAVLVGSKIVMEACGTFAANANNKRLRLAFGTGTPFDSGVVTHNARAWTLRVSSAPRSQFSWLTTCEFLVDGQSAVVSQVVQSFEVDQLADASAALKTTGVAAGDVLVEFFKTIYEQ